MASSNRNAMAIEALEERVDDLQSQLSHLKGRVTQIENDEAD